MTHLQQGWDATSQLSADAVQLAQRIQKDQQESAANHALAKQTFELLKKAALPSQDILSFLSSEIESIDVDKAQSALSTMSEVFLFYLILCSHGSIKQSQYHQIAFILSEVFLELELNHQKLIEGCMFFKAAQKKKMMEKLAAASGPRVSESDDPASDKGPSVS